MVKEEFINFLSSPDEDSNVPVFAIEEIADDHYLHPSDFLNPNTPVQPASEYDGSHLGLPLVYLAALDASLLLNLPYYDAVSTHLAPGDQFMGNTAQPQFSGTAPPIFDISTFDQEISLGQLVLLTNLPGLHPQFPQIPQFEHQFIVDQELATPVAPTTEQPPIAFGNLNPLTENNLLVYNQQVLLTATYPPKEAPLFPTINIQLCPEQVAAKTPSLFSNSLANSLVASNQKEEANLVPNSQLINSPLLMDGYLQPDEAQRRGRKLSHSSRSRGPSRLPGRQSLLPARSDILSHSDASQPKVNGTTNREKMLELALPNVLLKRTQKHPLVYACHLCEKRFTRPYNLKLHLRTHTDERPFICNVCGKAFARQHDRKRHEDLHTGEKKFQCKGLLKDGTPYGCGRKFARADALRRHFQTEAGKECIRLLIEEEEQVKGPGLMDFLSPLNYGVPALSILPPPDE